MSWKNQIFTTFVGSQDDMKNNLWSKCTIWNSNLESNLTYDLLKNMFANVGVHGWQGVIQQIHISITVHSSGQAKKIRKHELQHWKSTLYFLRSNLPGFFMVKMNCCPNVLCIESECHKIVPNKHGALIPRDLTSTKWIY